LATTDDVKSIALGKYLDSSPQIPIALANYKYNVIDTNAVANGQILQIDSMYYDASATSNPYITLQTFIASPLIDSIKSSNNTVLFNFSPELTFNKSNTPIISLNVNFGDGGPDQAIAMNAENSVAVNYSSSGYKILKFVAGLSDGSTSTTYAAVKVNVDDSGGLAPSGPTCNATDVFDKFTSDLIFQGYDETTATTGTGNVKIFYATNGNCDKILRKPIIILDGFDPGDNRKVDQLYDDYLNNRNKGGTLADDLRAQGFDLVLLNFPQYRIGTKTVGRVSVPIMRDGGADYIERNALILIKLIKYVNTNKQGTEKLIVIGPSMGGLISRYALKYMEQHNDPHQTKLWISFDSPHQGANIPIGDQWFLDYYAKKLDSEELKSNRDGKIGSTAAKQMLLHHYLANSESPIGAPGFRNRFVDMLNTIGFPSGDPGQPFRKVALIDGSLGGVEVNSAGQKGFTFDIRRRKTTFFFIRWRSLTVASARMYFSPSYGGNAQPVLDASYLFGSKTYRASTPSFTSGYDVAPGGKFDTQGVLYDEGNGTVQNVFFGLIAFQARFYSVVRDHSFISTKSALAFTGSNQNLSEDISTRSLVCTGETPFDSYYGDFNQNRDHVELWKDAISWVENEIKGSPQPPPVRNSSYSISGASSICNSQNNYTINGLPAGTTVNWSANPTNIVNISVNNNTATLTPIGNGSINLSATVTSACGSTIVTIPVGVGTPPTVTSISATMSGACRNGGYQDWYLQATPSNPNATNWRWTVDNPSSGYYYIQNPNSASTFVTVSGGGGVSVTYTDPCGNPSARNGVTIYSPCGRAGSIVSYPNPANNEMTVQYATASPTPQTSAATLSAGASTKTLNSFSVELYNDKGKVLRSGKTGNGNQNVVLSTADVPNGNYFLHVIDGKEVIKKQVVIQH